jgi:putative ABC transport system permease protein
MRLIDIYTTAGANMFRSKLRTSLTILAIFIGAFTLTLTSGLGAGIESYIDKQVGNLGAKDVLIIQAADKNAGGTSDDPQKYDANKRTASLQDQGNRTITVLTDQDITKIKAISGIKSAEPYQGATIDYVAGTGDGKYVASVAQYLTGAHYSTDAGRVPNNDSATLEAMVPTTYTKSLGFASANDAIGKTVKIGLTNGFGKQSVVSATIVGVQQKSLVDGGTLSLNSALVTELRRVGNEGLPPAATSTFQVATARFDTSLSETQVTALKDKLKDAGYTAKTVEDQIGTFKAVIGGIVAVLNGFAIIALLAASFGIVNTLLMSVQERTKEIGLMKAMGMSSGRIFLLFSFEAILLGFWGSAVGIAVAEVVGRIANHIVSTGFLKDLVGLQLLTFTPGSILAVMGLVIAIAFVAGTLPAYRAARQSPIDSLRYE